MLHFQGAQVWIIQDHTQTTPYLPFTFVLVHQTAPPLIVMKDI